MLKAVCLSLKEANSYVAENHRHHGPVIRDKFRVGCAENGKLVGVANVGRPLSRYLDDGKTLAAMYRRNKECLLVSIFTVRAHCS